MTWPPTLRLRPKPSPEGAERIMDDAGMTLIELLISSTLMVVLLTAVMVTMTVLNTVSNSVDAQTQEFNQALPALSPLQNLIRAEVEPGPASNGVPQPGFQSVGNFSLTFYSNVGTAYNNVTSAGTTGGPAKIVAQELGANGAPVTSATHCDLTHFCSFQVVQFLPLITQGVSQCPIAGGTGCTYPATGKILVNVLGVTNDPSAQTGGAPTQPIFSYNVMDPSSGVGVGSTYTAAQVQGGLTCTGSTATTCPADFIQSVGVDLMISRKGAGTNGTVDEQTIIYRYAKSTGATFAPYQYGAQG